MILAVFMQYDRPTVQCIMYRAHWNRQGLASLVHRTNR